MIPEVYDQLFSREITGHTMVHLKELIFEVVQLVPIDHILAYPPQQGLLQRPFTLEFLEIFKAFFKGISFLAVTAIHFDPSMIHATHGSQSLILRLIK